MKMDVGGASGVERGDLIKWWDVLDELVKVSGSPDIAGELEMARDCRHPDAQWLAALFPAGVPVSAAEARETLKQHGDDPRALCISCFLDEGFSDDAREQLRRAAELGYAPAQAVMSALTGEDEALMWATKSSSQGDRSGYMQLGTCFELAQGCERDMGKAIEMFKRAAELGHAEAQLYYGRGWAAICSGCFPRLQRGSMVASCTLWRQHWQSASKSRGLQKSQGAKSRVKQGCWSERSKHTGQRWVARDRRWTAGASWRGVAE
jgi:TPR repeat protein